MQMQKHMFQKIKNSDYQWDFKFLSQVNLPMLTTTV